MVAEQFADGLIGKKEFTSVWDWLGPWDHDAWTVARSTPAAVATEKMTAAAAFAIETDSKKYSTEVSQIRAFARWGSKHSVPRTAYDKEMKEQAGLVRDIFGNPFRSVTLNPAWQNATVVSLAQAIYDERAFDRMPILADALEDAGCTNADVLNHCRQPGEHVRGCWVVDFLLGKQ